MTPRGTGATRLQVSVLAAACVLALAACSGGADGPAPAAEPGSPSAAATTATAAGDAPLALDGSGRVCLTLRHGPDYTNWDHVLTPSQDLTLDRIDLVGAENVTVVGRGLVAPVPSAVPVSGWSNGWPTTGRTADNDRLAWGERTPASGATLRGEQAYNLFVHLRLGDGGAPATYEALRIHLTAAGEQHVVQDRIRVRVRDRCS